MSARQRLRAAFNASAAEKICWRCKLGLSRKFSSSVLYQDLSDEHMATVPDLRTIQKSPYRVEKASKYSLNLEQNDFLAISIKSITPRSSAFRNVAMSCSPTRKPHFQMHVVDMSHNQVLFKKNTNRPRTKIQVRHLIERGLDGTFENGPWEHSGSKMWSLERLKSNIGERDIRTERSRESHKRNAREFGVQHSPHPKIQASVNCEGRSSGVQDVYKKRKLEDTQSLEHCAQLNLSFKHFEGSLMDVELPNRNHFVGSEDSLAFRATDVRSAQNSNIDSRRKPSSSRPLKTGVRSYSTNANERTLTDRQPEDLTRSIQEMPIREHLRIWQEQQMKNDSRAEVPKASARKFFGLGDIQNSVTLSEEDDSLQIDDQNDEYSESALGGSLELDEHSAELPSDSFLFTRGDVAELRGVGNEPVLGVFVGLVGVQLLFYTMRGTWYARKSKTINFAVPHMFSSSDIDELLPYCPREEFLFDSKYQHQAKSPAVPLETRAKFTEKMIHFHQESHEIMRVYRGKLDKVFSLLAHPTKISVASLQDIALEVFPRKISADLTSPLLWAVHKTILETDCFNVRWFRREKIPHYFIISKEDARGTEDVIKWMREYQEDIVTTVTKTLKGKARYPNPIHDFVKKARHLIRDARKARIVTRFGAVGTNSSELGANCSTTHPKAKPVTFTVKERVILRFLLRWSASRFMSNHSHLRSIGPMILRAIGMYDDFELDQATGYVLLQELGCIAPWDNHNLLARKLPVVGHEFRFEIDRLKWQPRTSLPKFDMKDCMEGFRKGWENQVVFCIDSATTAVRDDGISLEEIEGDSSAFWVHIHVANPSAFLSPDCEFSMRAKGMISSVYYPEVTYPMLPPAFQSELSLAPGQPCITFSAKMTTEGHVIQREISHGLLRNVKYVTPEGLYQELGFEADIGARQFKFSVGDSGNLLSRSVARSQSLNQSDISKLRRLCELSAARRCIRRQKGALGLHLLGPRAELYVSLPENLQTANHFNLKQAQLFVGDPNITLTNTRHFTRQWTSPILIEEMNSDMMVLAGEIAAFWCSQRNIPVVFRGTLRNAETIASAEKFKKKILEPAIQNSESVSFGIVSRYAALMGRTTSSSSPSELVSAGVPMYCKATSPLRRYPDLIVHWQIEAALRHEAKTGISLIGSTDHAFLPFSRAILDAMIPFIEEREEAISFNQTFARRHWHAHLFFRAFHLKEAPLPDTFEVVVHTSAKISLMPWSRGWLGDFGSECQVPENDATTREGGIDSGDHWEVRISEVDVYHAAITVEALRLIKRADPEWSDARVWGAKF